MEKIRFSIYKTLGVLKTQERCLIVFVKYESGLDGKILDLIDKTIKFHRKSQMVVYTGRNAVLDLPKKSGVLVLQANTVILFILLH